MKLKVSFDESKKLLNTIPHSRCTDAIAAHWQKDGDSVKVQSICWLFCWAKTGWGSEKTASEAENVFDSIFDKSFSFAAAHIPHEWARKIRYEDMGKDYTEEFNAKLI
jgi:hypothetical protein